MHQLLDDYSCPGAAINAAKQKAIRPRPEPNSRTNYPATGRSFCDPASLSNEEFVSLPDKVPLCLCANLFGLFFFLISLYIGFRLALGRCNNLYPVSSKVLDGTRRDLKKVNLYSLVNNEIVNRRR